MRQSFLLRCALLVLFFSSSVPAVTAQEGTPELLAGAAKIDITPERPVLMGGYGARKGLSEGVHDRLSARAVAFESRGKRLVLLSMDLVGLDGTFHLFQQPILAEFGLKPEELLLAWTHTHSGPLPAVDKDKTTPENVAYTESLKPKFIKVIAEALKNRVPVRMGIGVGHSPVGASRRVLKPDGSTRTGGSSLVRNPYGPTDKEVLVLKVARDDGSPLAVLFDYATHNTSLGARNMQISGDLLGIAQTFTENFLGPGTIAPVFVGASGDINPWYAMMPSFETASGWIPEPILLGTLLGQEVVHVYRSIREVSPGGSVQTATSTIQVPGKKPQSLEIGKDPAMKTEITINAAKVGPLVMVAIPAGFGTELGLAIKAASPYKNTFVVTECNNKVGYIQPEYQYNQGGYEIWSSRCGPEAGESVVKAAVKLLHDLEK